MRRHLGRAGMALALFLVVGGSLLPFLWIALTSIKDPVEVTAIPPTLWPSGSFDFYRVVFTQHSLWRYLLNSAVVAGATTLLGVGLASLAAYALSRLRLPFRRVLLGLALLVSMFPQVAIVGPVWQVLRALGVLNSYPGLVAPYITLTLPLAIWILATFFRELPPELEEAARLDGCGPLGTLFRVILPVAAPGLFSAAILVFIYAWNEFFFALLIMTRPSLQTLPVGIALFQGQYTVPWGELAAASVVSTLPLIALVLFFQRRIVAGLSQGAVKG